MSIFAAFSVIPVGFLFLVSGLIINLIQLVLFIFVRPVSRSLYRRINKSVAELLWLELIWLVDWWTCMINLYADAETLELIGKEHALVLCNHRSDIDWLIGWVMAQRAGCLGSALAITMKYVKYIPAGFNQLKNFHTKFWLALFDEGIRITQENLEAAKDYASLKGLPSPRNVLIPRTKGFVSAVTHMRSFVPAVYDCTYTVHKKQSRPTMLRMLSGQSSEVNLQMRRYRMSELPETTDGIAQWCQDLFVAKDAQLENYFTNDVFSDLDVHKIGRPIKPVILQATSLALHGADHLFICLFLGDCIFSNAICDPVLPIKGILPLNSDKKPLLEVYPQDRDFTSH